MNELENIELNLFLESVFQYYGFDCWGYKPEYLMERIFSFIEKEGLTTISSLQEKVLHQKACFDRFMDYVTYMSVEMFSDSSFFKALREKVFPLLSGHESLRIWVAGCSTGEEVYSLAIMLHENGLLGKTRIYATDINETSLGKAKTGNLPITRMKRIIKNYLASGGTHTFSQYFTTEKENVVFSENVRRNITWSRHNLISEASFNEFQLILCRNVLFYFSNTRWQEHAHKVLFSSLADDGILILGTKESLTSPFKLNYTIMDEKNKIYQKSYY